jgi:hypothetical protein
MMSSIDFIGPQVGLNINQQTFFKTNFGAFTSFILLIITVGTFIGFGRDLWQKIDPKVTFNRIDHEDVPRKNITDSNVFLAVYYQSSFEPIAEFERKFSFYYVYQNMTGSGQVYQDIQYFEQCSPEVIDTVKSNLGANPNFYKCFPKGKNIEVYNPMYSGIGSLIKIEVEFCKNNSDISKGPIKSNCYTKEQTRASMPDKNIQMNIIFKNFQANNTNYENPTSENFESYVINTNTYTWSRLEVFFKEIEINTNVGFFWDLFRKISISSIDIVKSQSLYSPQSSNICSHLIGNSKYKEIYTRDYIKVQNVFALMGGFLNASMFILKFIVEYVERPKIIDIFNNIYKCVLIEEDKIIDFNKKFGNGDWGLGIGDWANPQSPIPNPQSPFLYIFYYLFSKIKEK